MVNGKNNFLYVGSSKRSKCLRIGNINTIKTTYTYVGRPLEPACEIDTLVSVINIIKFLTLIRHKGQSGSIIKLYLRVYSQTAKSLQ